MVVSPSSWVRPAQAIVYLESGEAQYFPPRGRGGLPRALTFHDHQTWENEEGYDLMDNYETDHHHHEQFEQCDMNEDCHVSYLVAEDLPKEFANIADPPEEYQSFELEYFQYSVLKNNCSVVDNEVPSMSTPTEQYSSLMRHQKRAAQSMPSPSKRESVPSTQSGATVDCFSPILQEKTDSLLSLDDLIDLYTQKMQLSRMTKMREALKEGETDSSKTSGEETIAENQVRREIQEVSNCSSAPYYQHQDRMDFCSTLRLRAVDVHLLVQRFEEIICDSDYPGSEDWRCLPLEDYEAILLSCCKENINYEIME